MFRVTTKTIISCVLVLILALVAGWIFGRPLYKRPENVTSSIVAKKLLVDGNRRFALGNPLHKDISTQRRKLLATKGQQPFAVILSCSDSRVPPEIIFDQGLGDLFVIRVAGNVTDPVIIGSVEYAVEHFNTPLIVVLGHEKCGAVQATVEAMETQTMPHGDIASIVAKIMPAVKSAAQKAATKNNLTETATIQNIKLSINHLKKSKIICDRLRNGKLGIAGAEYNMNSGKVLWFNSVK